MNLRLSFTVFLLCGLLGACKTNPDHTHPEPRVAQNAPDASPDKELADMTPHDQTPTLNTKWKLDDITPHPTPEAEVESPASHVFIAKPRGYEKDSQRLYKAAAAPRRPPRPMNDATDYVDRYGVHVDVVEVIKGPKYTRADSLRIADAKKDSSFDMLFTVIIGELPPYSQEDAEHFVRMDQAFEHPYVVLFGAPIHVDRGNHPPLHEGEWRNVGANPSWPHRGFETLEAAQDYAKKFR